MMHIFKKKEFGGEKIPFWRTWHCTTAFVPSETIDIPCVVLHEKARSLSTIEEKAEFLKERKRQSEEIQHFEPLSGFYSSLAAILSHKYKEFVGDVKSYVLCYYFHILRHTFTPEDRLREHSIYALSSDSGPLKFFSVLSHISYNVRACLLYSEARSLGRKKYLRYFDHSYILEIFKGIEYLAKLFYLKIDTKGVGKVFKDFIVETTTLNPKEAEALWEFRCGLAHRGTLYNVNHGKVFRFGYSWYGFNVPIVKRDPRVNQIIQKGKKYIINLDSLYLLFIKSKKHVYRHMQENYLEYALHDNFHNWVRWYWTQQYLPDENEYEDFLRTQQDAWSNFDLVTQGKERIAEYVMIKLPVRRDKVFRLRWNDLKEDLHSRLRDFLAK